MGVFDSYGNAQLKIGDVCCQNFDIGDKVPLPDGVYLDHECIIVILHGKFIAEFEHLTDKWGRAILSDDVLDFSISKCRPYPKKRLRIRKTILKQKQDIAIKRMK